MLSSSSRSFSQGLSLRLWIGPGGGVGLRLPSFSKNILGLWLNLYIQHYPVTICPWFGVNPSLWFIHLVNLSYGSCSLGLNHASVVSFIDAPPLCCQDGHQGRSLKQVGQLWWQEYSHGSCPSRAWTRPRCRPCRPWCERWPAMTCELRTVHLEWNLSLELFPCHVDCLREIPSANSCIPILSSLVRIFLFQWQHPTFLGSIFSGQLSITFNISTMQISSPLMGCSVHVKHNWKNLPTFSTFSIHSAIFWWRMS